MLESGMPVRVEAPVEPGWIRPEVACTFMPAVLADPDVRIAAWDLHAGPCYSIRLFVDDGADGQRVAKSLWLHMWAIICTEGDEHYEVEHDFGLTRISLSRLPHSPVTAATPTVSSEGTS